MYRYIWLAHASLPRIGTHNSLHSTHYWPPTSGTLLLRRRKFPADESARLAALVDSSSLDDALKDPSDPCWAPLGPPGDVLFVAGQEGLGFVVVGERGPAAADAPDCHQAPHGDRRVLH